MSDLIDNYGKLKLMIVWGIFGIYGSYINLFFVFTNLRVQIY